MASKAGKRFYRYRIVRKASCQNIQFFRMNSCNDLSRYWDHGGYHSDNNQWCFEIAWEVANKVDGIIVIVRVQLVCQVGSMLSKPNCGRLVGFTQ